MLSTHAQEKLSRVKKRILLNLGMKKTFFREITPQFGVHIGTLDVGDTNVAIPLSNNHIGKLNF